MDGSSAIHYPVNEQLVGKFHVTTVENLPVSTLNNHDDSIPQTSLITDEPGCPSRFQMIRVDRNFGRGRWKVNDYEPPENTLISTLPPVHTMENEPIHIGNNSTIPHISANIPAVIPGDLNPASSATLAITAPPAAAATANGFQQQRMTLNNTPTLMPVANVPPQPGLLHPYPSAALANQSYLLANHHHPHQFGYYPFYPPPYPPYGPSWGAPAIPYLPHPQTASQLPSTGNLNDHFRLTDIGSDMNVDNPMISSTNFSYPTTDHLQNAQLAALASFLFGPHHSPFAPQTSSTASPYTTIPSYHPVHHPPPQTLPLSQIISNNTTDTQQFHQAPLLTSPIHDATKGFIQHSSLITTPQTKPLVTPIANGINNDPSKTTHVNDSIAPYHPFISSGTVNSTDSPTATLSNIWPYTTTGSPLILTRTAQTAVAAMGLLNNANSQNTGIASEILKEILKTPAKQNNTADIDNKISAAMDLVKMHLLSAVREEVTELRQQIRTLNEKINSIEHENTFLRQYVPSEIYAQYIPIVLGLSSSNDSNNSTMITNTISAIPLSSSNQTVPINSLASIQQPIPLPNNLQPSLLTINPTAT